MYYAMVNRYGYISTEKFETKEEAVDYLKTVSDNGEALDLGFVDYETDIITVSNSHKSLVNGLTIKQNYNSFYEQIQNAYLTHDDILARKKYSANRRKP